MGEEVVYKNFSCRQRSDKNGSQFSETFSLPSILYFTVFSRIGRNAQFLSQVPERSLTVFSRGYLKSWNPFRTTCEPVIIMSKASGLPVVFFGIVSQRSFNLVNFANLSLNQFQSILQLKKNFPITEGLYHSSLLWKRCPCANQSKGTHVVTSPSGWSDPNLPALPEICLACDGVSRSTQYPSYFCIALKTIRFIFLVNKKNHTMTAYTVYSYRENLHSTQLM
jgi:hypothetical protein